ncbi:MAG: FAD-binding protein [Phycisphaeraceae bacterium]|nr:FAD-binding protein [Phycisphaeraceae bacterium]
MSQLRVLNNRAEQDRETIGADLRRLLAEAGGPGAAEGRSEQVRFDEHSRMLYATDASLYQVEPIGVVVPGSIDEAARVVRYCGERGVALLPRGGGTSLAGQATGHAVVMDLSARCRGIGEVRPAGEGGGIAEVEVEPGVVVDELNRELARRRTGLFFAPDPATVAQAAIGGCIGNNAAGARSIRYGRTSENLSALDVMLTTGERVVLEPGAGRRSRVARRLAEGVIGIVRPLAGLIRERFPRTIRRNAGYGLDLILGQLEAGATAESLDLSGLLCGSEGTLAVTLGARLKLHPFPRARGLAVVSFGSVEEAIGAVTPILGVGLARGLSAVELLDDVVLEAARGNIEYRKYVDLLPGASEEGGGQPRAALYVEFFGFGEEAAREVSAGFGALEAVRGLAGFAGMAVYSDEAAMLSAWKLRRAGEPLLHGLPGKRKPITFVEDNAVPVERLGEFVREFKKIVARHGTRAAYWAHASVGVLHVRPMIDIHEEKDRDIMRAIAVEVADLARACGGIMSGEHGDGKVRGPLVERFFGPELMRAFAEVKRLFDPKGLLNPGNIVGAGPVESISQRLRVNPVGAEVRVPAVETYFDYEDQHGFAGAVEMCNGAGVCRKTSGGTMCPSYRATMDERHATRGRGNALRLAITGQIGRDAASGRLGDAAWDDAGTMETLHLCLSCKACKSECPSNVDIARLKAEYTAQRYLAAGGPPLAARLFGHVRVLNRLGSLTPGLANWVNSTALAKWVARRVLGIDRRRDVPRFRRSLYSMLERRRGSAVSENPRPAAPRVVLFADCFTAYNEPSIGMATAHVLGALGYGVDLIPKGLKGQWGGCCGRAMISTGLLEDAIETADRTMEMLRPAIEDDSVAAIVVVEPSCLSAMTDDWRQLKLKSSPVLRGRLAAKAMLVEDFVERLWDRHPVPGPEAFKGMTEAGAGVLLHGHCHQKALWGVGTSERLLRRLVGGRLRVLDSGCCGMAGSFGYTADRYDLSMRIGELSVFPPVRAAGADETVVAPGTSCRHQIHDGTGRAALHPIEFAERMLASPAT